jgi:hypothetical protein
MHFALPGEGRKEKKKLFCLQKVDKKARKIILAGTVRDFPVNQLITWRK